MLNDLVEFKEALKQQDVKALLPTELTHEQISALDAALREQAFWSARTTNAKFLQEARDVIRAVLNPKTITLPSGVKVTRGMSITQARARLLQLFPDVHGPARLNLILRTQTDMAYGYGYWKQGQTKQSLLRRPAYELFRAEDRKEPRDWPVRWQDNGGEFYPGTGSYPEGRMIAAKNDPIWEKISAFGLPYPPFDFNSGMNLREIDRDEAIALGVPGVEDVEPEDRDFADVENAGVDDMDEDMQQALLDSLGPGYAFEDGVLVHAE